MKCPNWRAIRRQGAQIQVAPVSAYKLPFFGLTELRDLAREHRWHVKTPTKVNIIDEVYPTPVTDTHTWLDSCQRNSVVSVDGEATPARLTQHGLNFPRQPAPTISEGHSDHKSPIYSHGEVDCHVAADVRSEQIEERHQRRISVDCPPLSQWQSLAPRAIPQKMHLAPVPVVNKVAVAHSSTLELTRFQRFIRRMERAGPKIILERLREDWQEASGDEPDEQVSFLP